ncbi:Diacylglycerol O-acyltransferase 2-like protein 6 [Allomyces arbusculus]|nr:Diacylglycerol O-acyltransferase 2-like protein 6 [Allomyces arbusculus]
MTKPTASTASTGSSSCSSTAGPPPRPIARGSAHPHHPPPRTPSPSTIPPSSTTLRSRVISRMRDSWATGASRGPRGLASDLVDHVRSESIPKLAADFTATMRSLAECSAVVLWTTLPFVCAFITFGTVYLAIAAEWEAVRQGARVLIAGYAAWVAADWATPFEGGSDRLRSVRAWSGWAHWRAYFPARLVKTAPLPPDRNYIVGLHPHGLYCFSAFSNFVSIDDRAPHVPDHHVGECASGRFHKLFPGVKVRLATLRSNFAMPLWREVNLAFGFVSVDATSCRHWLTRGDGKVGAATKGTMGLKVRTVVRHEAQAAMRVVRDRHDSGLGDELADETKCDDVKTTSITEILDPADPHAHLVADPLPTGTPPSQGEGRALLICIGGAEESLRTTPGRIELVLHKRKGFVKLALHTGAALVPTLAFGEVDIFHHAVPEPGSALARAQQWMKRVIGWSIPLVYGRIGMWLPLRRSIVTVVGKPLDVPHVPGASGAIVDEWHARYVDAVVQLWEEWRDKYPSAATGKPVELKIVA